jgi:protein TonB
MRRQADQIVVTSRFRFTRDDGLETTMSTATAR